MSGSFPEAFGALSDKQRRAGEANARRTAQRAADNARVRLIAEPVLRAAGIAVRDKLVELGVPIPVNSDVWHVGPDKVRVCAAGFISDRHDLTGPEGLEDLLSRIQPLPAHPTQGDVSHDDTVIRVDAAGQLVVTYAHDGLDIRELHTYLAEAVQIMAAHHERDWATAAARAARESARQAEQAAWRAAHQPTPPASEHRSHWWSKSSR